MCRSSKFGTATAGYRMGISVQKIYFDSNLYISVLNKDALTDHVVMLFEQAEADVLQITSSVLVYGEVIKTSSTAAYGHTVQFLDVLPVTFTQLDKGVMLRAAKLRIDHPTLKLPDAIHIAAALISNCDLLLSEDKQLTKIAKEYLPADSVLTHLS